MAIELFFSNRLEVLADKFAAIVDLERHVKRNILEGPLTIVPNQNLVKWLQLTLAGKRSVFMNVDFQYLESGLWDLLAGLDPAEDRPEMMGSSHLRMFLLRELMGLREDDTDFTPLRKYLLEPDGRKGPGYAVKLWQLTERMVRLFEAYQFHRSDMIRQWLDSRYRPQGMERCQQRLYLRMRDLRDRYVQGTQKRLLSLGEYADEVLAEGHRDPEGGRAGKFVHLFGLSQVSPFHLGLIGRLKDDYSIFIYSLNPCREFWEDIKTPQEKKWIQRRSVKRLEITPEERARGELLEAEDNELLALWGKPGREHIRLLCQLTDYDLNACFTKEAGRSSVLETVQRHILTLSTQKDARDRLPQDRSLQVMACPGIYREVETVYNNIIHNLEADAQLQLTDIAIFVPDISTYKPAIDSVFNRRPRRLLYNLVDSRADIESVYGQAVSGILDLAAGRFSRKEVFDLILNPCFMNRWQIGFEEVNIWARWAEAMNIFHSFDKSSKEKRGYPANSYYTWKQGLQRLRLSRILSAPDEGSADEGFGHSFDCFQEQVPFHDVHTGDADLMEKFSLVIERLYRSVTELAGLRASGEEWASRFLKACDELLSVPPDLRGESAVQTSLVEAFGDLKIYDQLLRDSAEKERAGLKLDIEMVREFVKSSLGSISGGYGDYLTEGVTISALQPMRPIPFRIVYVLGMEEGAFPGKGDVSSLDLRLLKRRIGDISLPERNRYLFLEMLLSVRDKLYISYVAKDLQKDRMIQPCSVVNQLRRYVEQEVLSRGETFSVTEIPLKGSSERYLAADAVNDISDVLVNYSLADRIAFYRENDLWETAATGMPDALRGHLRAFFPDFAVAGERAQKDDRMVERITVKQLKTFLEDPVTQGLKRHLGIYDEEETIRETTLREDEPFYSEFPVDYELKMTPLRLWLDTYSASGGPGIDPQTPIEIYDGVYEGLRRKSTTPEGAFAELDREALGEDVSMRAGSLAQVLAEMASGEKTYRVFFMGEQTGETISPLNRLPVERFEPVRLMIRTADDAGKTIEIGVEVHGQLPWVWKDHGKEWHALVLTGSGKSPGKEPDKYILGPLLFWLGCLSTDSGRKRLGGAGITFHVVYKEKVKTWTYRFEQGTADVYLTRLVSDYLNRERLEWLPFDAVTSQSVKPHRPKDNDVDEGDRETFYAQLREAYLEEKSFLVRLADPHIPEDAFDKVRDRFRIFFATQGSDVYPG
ncbi:MAG: exodeoxyribonuclease V subunit gamma [Proteobacteria bacterium]|nr:exodeoxyribonuclease V subunit gamma [Pseudomonadota bacterium]